MASPTITAAEVRFLLQSHTDLDITDPALASAAFIPAADAKFNVKIGSGTTLTVGSDAEALVKAAKIAYVCITVINAAPIQLTKTSVIDPKYIPAELKKSTIDTLNKMIAGNMRDAGYPTLSFYSGTTSVNDDYGYGIDLHGVND